MNPRAYHGEGAQGKQANEVAARKAQISRAIGRARSSSRKAVCSAAVRKVVVHRPGGYDRLTLETYPDPRPGRGEVLVRTEAIGVNYADCIVRMGLYESAKKYVGWPITPGFEVAGVVEAVGEGTAHDADLAHLP